MATLHITEKELANDLHGILQKVRQGTEVVIEQDSHPIAVIRVPYLHGRSIDQCIQFAAAHGSHVTLDDEFSKDLLDIVAANREPMEPPSWD
jgi:antitoxin (DNA-binding transcriptional repressor) of toxin-antitoxin stability system